MGHFPLNCLKDRLPKCGSTLEHVWISIPARSPQSLLAPLRPWPRVRLVKAEDVSLDTAFLNQLFWYHFGHFAFEITIRFLFKIFMTRRSPRQKELSESADVFWRQVSSWYGRSLKYFSAPASSFAQLFHVLQAKVVLIHIANQIGR